MAEESGRSGSGVVEENGRSGSAVAEENGRSGPGSGVAEENGRSGIGSGAAEESGRKEGIEGRNGAVGVRAEGRRRRRGGVRRGVQAFFALIKR